MAKHKLPLPTPPGGFLICNDNEYCYADTHPGPGKPTFECVADDDGPEGPSQQVRESTYEAMAKRANLQTSMNDKGQLGLRLGDDFVKLRHVDIGCQILLDNNKFFGGVDILEACEIIQRAISADGYNQQFLKLPEVAKRSEGEQQRRTIRHYRSM